MSENTKLLLLALFDWVRRVRLDPEDARPPAIVAALAQAEQLAAALGRGEVRVVGAG